MGKGEDRELGPVGEKESEVQKEISGSLRHLVKDSMDLVE